MYKDLDPVQHHHHHYFLNQLLLSIFSEHALHTLFLILQGIKRMPKDCQVLWQQIKMQNGKQNQEHRQQQQQLEYWPETRT